MAADCLDAAVYVPRKVWTREEAHALADLGLLTNAEKWELIEGDIIDRVGKKRPHVIWQNLLHEWLGEIFSMERVESESPNDVAKHDNQHSEPEPDLKVLRNASREYSLNPQPEDILLLVEIADSTVQFDLKVKARLYARAEIVEYWVLNISEKLLVVHREPKDGVYTSVKAYRTDENVFPVSCAPCDLLHGSPLMDRL